MNDVFTHNDHETNILNLFYNCVIHTNIMCQI